MIQVVETMKRKPTHGVILQRGVSGRSPSRSNCLFLARWHLESGNRNLRGLSEFLYLYRFQVKPLQARPQATLRRNSCPDYPAAPRLIRRFCGIHYVRLLGGANLAAQRLAFTEQKMSTHRVYKSHEFMQPAEKEPIRSVVVESSHSVIVAWHVEPGQTIAPHIHPDGQDTWTILSGEGQYQIDEQGNTVAIVPGDIVVANKGQVHGVLCTSVGPLRFISVVAPLDAGYEPLSAKT